MDPLDADPARLFDTVVAAYLLDSVRSDFADAHLAETYLHAALPAAAGEDGAPADAPSAAARGAWLARILREPLAAALEAQGAEDIFTKIEMPLVRVLASMERAGMYVDPARLAAQSEELSGQIAELSDRIRELAGGEEFNLSSPMQLSRVLFDKLGLPTAGLKKTQRGYYSTNAKVLEDLAKDYEIVRLILEYRERTKIKSTYLDTLGALRETDGRVHTTYNQTITATGRLSSSNPNLQNIPTRSELGHAVKKAFSVEEGLGLRRHRLLADRAEVAGAPLGRRAPGERVQRGRGLPRRDGGACVRRAGRGGHAAAAQPRQGGELWYRVWPAGLRFVAGARHPPWRRRAR